MQSANYVPGVSGWKLHKESGELEIEGVVRVIGLTGCTPAPDSEPLAPLEKIAVANVTHESSARCQADERVATHIGAMECNLPKPFVIVDGVTYIRQDHVDKSSVQAAKLAPEWTVKLKLVDGQYVAAGIGLGIASQFLVSANQFAIKEPNGFEAAREKGTDAVADFLADKILDTKLGEDLKAKISTVDLIKEAVMQGVTLGYQATLKDLGKTI
jgi:hypothetical protein